MYKTIVMASFFQRYPISFWPLLCAAFVLILAALGPDVRNALKLDLQLTDQGQWWRIFSAHWVHLGWPHSLLNAGGFALVAWMHPRGHWLMWLGFYCVASVCISSFLLFDSTISSYVGASGVLHGLLILAAFYSYWLEPWRKALMILAILAKLVWEQTTWYSDKGVSAMIGGNVAVDAHFIGGLCGLLIILSVLINYRGKLK